METFSTFRIPTITDYFIVTLVVHDGDLALREVDPNVLKVSFVCHREGGRRDPLSIASIQQEWQAIDLMGSEGATC
jgi:hypothetical protein